MGMLPPPRIDRETALAIILAEMLQLPKTFEALDTSTLFQALCQGKIKIDGHLSGPMSKK